MKTLRRCRWLLGLLAPGAWAQDEANNWYFGAFSALTFNSRPPRDWAPAEAAA